MNTRTWDDGYQAGINDHPVPVAFLVSPEFRKGWEAGAGIRRSLLAKGYVFDGRVWRVSVRNSPTAFGNAAVSWRRHHEFTARAPQQVMT